MFLAWSTTLLEYTLAFGLPIRRLRPYLLWGGVLLHLGILMGLAVTYFSFMMILIFCCACRRSGSTTSSRW